jgi:hypothetical protein
MAASGMARPQGRRPAAVFYPFGHPLPQAYDSQNEQISSHGEFRPERRKMIFCRSSNFTSPDPDPDPDLKGNMRLKGTRAEKQCHTKSAKNGFNFG